MNHTCRNSLCQDCCGRTALKGDKNDSEYVAIVVIDIDIVVIINGEINKYALYKVSKSSGMTRLCTLYESCLPLHK